MWIDAMPRTFLTAMWAEMACYSLSHASALDIVSDGRQVGMEWLAPSPKLHLFLTRDLTVLFFSALFWVSAVIVNVSAGYLGRCFARKAPRFLLSPALGIS